jgi:hypothetical protein
MDSGPLTVIKDNGYIVHAGTVIDGEYYWWIYNLGQWTKYPGEPNIPGAHEAMRTLFNKNLNYEKQIT